ncbi:MAG: hypothetical protein NTV23_00380 [Propionibacteriales bacterium]|nr:hypothetical protein [Propionibacteriales bacterium]
MLKLIGVLWTPWRVRLRQLTALLLLVARFAAAGGTAWAVHRESVSLMALGVGAFLVLQWVRQSLDRAIFEEPSEDSVVVIGSIPEPALDLDSLRVPSLSVAQVSTIALAFSDPQRIIKRIKERVSLLTRAMEIESDYWLTVPVPAGSDSVLFPILTPNKGKLLDQLSITLTDGTELSTVTFEESLGLVMACIDDLARRCGTVAFTRYQVEVRTDLVHAIASRGEAASDQRHLHAVWRLAGILGTSLPANLAGLIATNLTKRYVIFARIPVPVEQAAVRPVDLVVRVRRTALQTRAKGGLISRLRRWYADLLGVRPSTFTHPVEQAARTGSYHLEFFGPVGTWLAEQELFLEESTQDRPFRYARYRSRLGQRYSHLYIRGADLPIVHGRLHCRFNERTPGSIGPATIAALAALVGAYASSRVALAPVAANPGSDAVALLVALPGVASGWLGLDRSGNLVGGVLAARTVSTITFLLACVAILLFFVRDIPGWLVRGVPQWLGLREHLTYENTWTVLLTLGAITWVMAASSWMRRSALEAKVVKKVSRRDA